MLTISRKYEVIFENIKQLENEIKFQEDIKYPKSFYSVCNRHIKINEDREIQRLYRVLGELKEELRNATPPAMPKKEVKSVDEFSLENESIIAEILSLSERLESLIKLLEDKAKKDGIRFANQRIAKVVKFTYTHNGIIIS